MPPTTQDRFMEALAATAKARGCDLRIDPTYANVGTARFHRSPQDFGAPVLKFRYHFDNGAATFSHGITAHAKYDDGDLDRVLDTVAERLAELVAPVTA